MRARKKIRDDNIPFEVPFGPGLEKRLQTVLETIYLLFNEGYSASSGIELIRYEICEEAMRLADIIANRSTIQSKSDVYALLALMQLNASRFKARQDEGGNILTLEKQNRTLWDYSLMETGFTNLEKSTSGGQISAYHILATISAYHCSATSYESTDWKSILSLYDKLIEIDNSPVVLLNRAIVISKLSGAQKAIMELDKIKTTLKTYYLFYSTQASFFIELNQYSKAIKTLETAIKLAPLQTEKMLLKEKLSFCREKII